MKPGPLLVVVPRAPSRAEAAGRLLGALARNGREVDAVASAASGAEAAALRRLGARPAPDAPDALAARARAACARRTYDAIVVVDSPATRAAVEELAEFSRRPVVLVQLGPEAPDPGEGFLSARRARDRAARGLALASEVWSFEDGPEAAPGWTRARPRAFVRRARLDARWISARLAALAAGRAAPLESGLASIVIPCWNNLADTKACLLALAERTDAPHEIVVVDNGSTDGTADWVRRNSKARVIRHASNRGFARAINVGMRAARGRWLVWLNNDVIVTPGWLTRLTAAAARAPWIGAVGPCTNETVGPQRVEGAKYDLASGLPLFSEAWALQNAGRARAAHRLTGFCLLVRREAYAQIGGLDERFGVGTYEEYDYCLRLRQAGWELAVAEDCYVHHHGSRTFRSREAMERQAAANRDLFVEKWCRRSLEFLDELNPELTRRARRR